MDIVLFTHPVCYSSGCRNQQEFTGFPAFFRIDTMLKKGLLCWLMDMRQRADFVSERSADGSELFGSKIILPAALRPLVATSDLSPRGHSLAKPAFLIQANLQIEIPGIDDR